MIFSITPEEKKILQTISVLAKKKKTRLYLVGGYLRDMLLGREKINPDFDFSLRKGAINLARLLSRQLRAGFVILDKEHGCARLVKRLGNKVYTLDFTDFRGSDLPEDLLHRDFSINTLALDLESFISLFVKSGLRVMPRQLEAVIIDRDNAIKDLNSKIIRIANKKSFDEDPLRILRAFSLAAIFGFRIDQETLRLIRLKRNKLSGVSFERIRDELFKILGCPDAITYLISMDKLRVLSVVLPEIEIMRGVKQGPYHHLDVFCHTLETIRQIEKLMLEKKDNKNIQDYLDEIISGDRRRRALIKLGALLHDIGKPQAMRQEDGKTKFHGHERIGLHMAEDIARRFKLSNDEIDSLRKMVFWHLRPGYLADNEEITPRAIFRYFRDTAQEGVSILLLSIADQRATKGPLTSDGSRRHHEKVVSGLIRRYFIKQKEKKMPRLITGDDLIEKFKLEPSPLMGKILGEIEELQAIGKIKTKKQAFDAARKLK